MAIVCVTGGSGYIGSHVVRELLERGHKVRTTVRDPNNPEKTEHIKKLAAKLDAEVELFSADLLSEGSFDDAFEGCDAVVHTAAAVRLSAADPQSEIVDPSVKGTQNVLASIKKNISVKRLVHTSSVAAIFRDHEPEGTIYTEDDWNTNATLTENPYGLAKTLAEKQVWAFCEGLARGREFSVAVINPALVLGPVYTKAHSKGSPMVVRDLVIGTFPALPAFSFGLVDVRDVAIAHARAVEDRNVTGRYMLHNGSLWMVEMAKKIAKLFPTYKIRTWRMPGLLMYLAPLFDKRISSSMVRRYLNKQSLVDNSRSRDSLKLEYRPLDQTLHDTVDSLVAGGFATPR